MGLSDLEGVLSKDMTRFCQRESAHWPVVEAETRGDDECC